MGGFLNWDVTDENNKITNLGPKVAAQPVGQSLQIFLGNHGGAGPFPLVSLSLTEQGWCFSSS